MQHRSKNVFSIIVFHPFEGLGLLIFALVIWAQSPAQACGYHDPELLKIGYLTWFYPESGHVSGAIWEAEKAGKLPWPDMEHLTATGPYREQLDAAAFARTEQALNELGDNLGRLTAEGHTEEFAMVMIDSGMWSKFTLKPMKSAVWVDIGGPENSDLVVVTGEPVLYAIVQGDMTLSAAVSSGLMKLYGEPQRTEEYIAAYGKTGG